MAWGRGSGMRRVSPGRGRGVARDLLPRQRMKYALVGLWALALTLASAGAHASTSIAASWDGLLHESSAAAVVTAVESRSAWENGRIYTYTRVHVDRAIAGELATGGEAWVRTMGGVVGKVGQVVEGEAVLVPGQTSLIFLHHGPAEVIGAYEVTSRGQGQFAVVPDAKSGTRLVRATKETGIVLPHTRPPLAPPRLAAEVLHGRMLEDVAREVAASWSAAHAR